MWLRHAIRREPGTGWVEGDVQRALGGFRPPNPLALAPVGGLLRAGCGKQVEGVGGLWLHRRPVALKGCHTIAGAARQNSAPCIPRRRRGPATHARSTVEPLRSHPCGGWWAGSESGVGGEFGQRERRAGAADRFGLDVDHGGVLANRVVIVAAETLTAVLAGQLGDVPGAVAIHELL